MSVAHRIADCSAGPAGGDGEQGHPGSKARESQLPWKPRDGEGRSVFRKGKHCRANYGHFSSPPSWDHFSYKLFLASDGATTGPEKPIGAGCVPGARAVAGTRGGRPGGALTWQLLGGARATALREAVAGCARLRAVLFPPSGRRFPRHANQ